MQKNRRESVAFIWGVAFIKPKKKKIEVYALIRSVAFIRVLPLLGKPRKIPAYALIRSVASIWAKLGAELYQKWPKKGAIFFWRLRRKFFPSVAFIWVLPLLGHNKFASKALPLFGVLPLLILKKMKVWGVTPPQKK